MRASPSETRTLTIDAVSARSALGFCEALSAFRTKLVEAEDGHHQVEVTLTSGRETVAILSALQEHITRCETGPARVKLDGRNYMLHPD